MRQKYVVGNWKMNETAKSSISLVKKIDELLGSTSKVEVVVCPTPLALSVLKPVKGRKIKLGAQNGHQEDSGVYTGEVSMAQVSDFAQYVIVGHSSRREFFAETNDIVALKMAAAIRNELTPVLCIGENKNERDNGETKQVIKDQLNVALSHLTTKDMRQVVLVYEPIWAISSGDGHGTVAEPDDIAEAVAQMRAQLGRMFGERTGKQTSILYGGSSNDTNAPQLITIAGVDGFLPGGASLHPNKFASMVAAVQDFATK